MDRIDVILKIDHACAILEEAMEMLVELGASRSYNERLYAVVRKLEDFRVDVYSADLPNEPESEEK